MTKDYYSKISGKYLSFKDAKKNGLFENPKKFNLPSGVLLNLKTQKANTIGTIRQYIREGKITIKDVFTDDANSGWVSLPKSNKIVKLTKKNKETIIQQAKQEKKPRIHTSVETFKNVAFNYKVTTDREYNDVLTFQHKMRGRIDSILQQRLKKGPFKATITINIDMMREGDVKPSAHNFSSGLLHKNSRSGVFYDSSKPITNTSEINQAIKTIMEIINDRLDTYIENGSQWRVIKINYLKIKTVKFTPFKGGSYIESPEWIRNKKCCINVKNENQECFKYAILSAIHYNDIKKPERVSEYKKYENELDFTDITFPVESTSYELFETQNDIPINVFGVYADSDRFDYEVEYINKYSSPKTPINLLRIYDNDKAHYVWIKNINGFVKTKKGEDIFCCSKCLQRFTQPNMIDKHINEGKCIEHKIESIKMLPSTEKDKHICRFTNIHKQLPAPFVIYADCESALQPIDIKSGEGTTAYQTHKVLNVGCKLVSRYPEVLDDEYRQFDGENCMINFLEYILEIQKEAKEATQLNRELDESKMSHEDWINFNTAKCCHICDKKFESKRDKVKDHDHITGLFRGAAHSSCNIKYAYKKNYKLPILFHNLRGYDSHLILQYAGRFQNEKITCIPNTMEKYLSFSFGGCVFLDSLQFTLSSLEALVANLNKVKDERNFKTFNDSFPMVNDEVKQLLRQKGIFPYEWYTSKDKWDVSELPNKKAFFSTLSNEHVKEDDYKRALDVWNKAECGNFYDYLSLYLKTDVVLLADVFEAFRNMCLTYYGLDPCHYFTAPGFSWDAMLKMTDVKIECFSEGQEKYLDMVQRGMRGGISTVTKRFAKANNKYMKTFDKDLPSSYIVYLDANNLYGWAMSQYLPIGDFKLIEDDLQLYTVDYIKSINDDADFGFIAECDIDIPEELHDYFNDYPLAPESTSFEPSPKIKALGEFLNIKESKINKLIPNLNNKTNYVLHYRNLKLYLSLGAKLKKVHRVITFKQEPYLKKYIDFNTSKRAASKNDFEKDLFKLFNNAIFGKTCENVDKRIEVVLTSETKKFVNKASHPLFKDFRIFSNDLVAIEMKRKTIEYTRPMVVGMCILDLSKVLMYDFHYNYIKATYKEKAQLCFTDTDSLTYHIETEDFYQDMKENEQLFDTSDYPKSHFCYSEANKKVIGKFKDETNAEPIEEFCGLRSKMYSILKAENKSKATAKGIKKNVIKTLKHDDYKKAIFGTTAKELQQKVEFNLIRSVNHQVNTINVIKTGLCAYDDKRYILDNNIDSLAHGHLKALPSSV